jgi:hypothetical protein
MPSASDPKALHIANHLRLAAEDAKDGRTLLAVRSRNAAYHAQQAAEKLLLALLTSENLHAQRHESHQLGIMLEKLPPDHPMLADLTGVFDGIRDNLPIPENRRAIVAAARLEQNCRRA